jgi:hypothetical protein
VTSGGCNWGLRGVVEVVVVQAQNQVNLVGINSVHGVVQNVHRRGREEIDVQIISK